ncbi:hypothetical protein G6M26_25670 [Agrobacterium tumefaciens]|nr:hypothetical protein [Agrobacterium tumefaciens]NTE21938.1 hypothetical protein [Agrobacterium tumefaciens]
MKAAKNRGVELGRNDKLLSAANKKAAEDFAHKLSPVIQRLKNRGIVTERTVCNALNKKKCRLSVLAEDGTLVLCIPCSNGSIHTRNSRKDYNKRKQLKQKYHAINKQQRHPI